MSLVSLNIGLLAIASALTGVDTFLMLNTRVKKPQFWFVMILVAVLVLVASILWGYSYNSFWIFLVMFGCFGVGLTYPLYSLSKVTSFGY